MASIGTPWVMGYHPTTGKADSWNVTRPTNAEDAEVYGVETGLNWEFYPAWKEVVPLVLTTKSLFISDILL